jgi:hypothetical protein
MAEKKRQRRKAVYVTEEQHRKLREMAARNERGVNGEVKLAVRKHIKEGEKA